MHPWWQEHCKPLWKIHFFALFGGYVYDYVKDPFTSTLNNSDFHEVKEHLEDGVSLITFLGHSDEIFKIVQIMHLKYHYLYNLLIAKILCFDSYNKIYQYMLKLKLQYNKLELIENII